MYYVDFMPPKKIGLCEKDGGKLIIPSASDEEVKEDFLLYLKEISPVIDYLTRFSEVSFDVSGDDDYIVIFSNILLKLKHGTKAGHKIFRRQSSSMLETTYGNFRLISYQSKIDYTYHLALVFGRVKNGEDVLVRVHSSCITRDIFNSLKCDCGEQLGSALEKISAIGKGVIVYLFQEGRGINIVNKIQAYGLQRKGFDTVEANELLGFPSEMRDYHAVKDILEDLGIKSVAIMTNNPDKINKITDLGVIISKIVPLEIKPGEYNRKYLATKKKKMKHNLFHV